MKDINAKHVIVIVTFLVTTAALVALGKDVAAFVVVGLAILGGIGVVISKQAETKQETQVIREQTNGTQSAMLAHLVEQQRENQAITRQLMAVIERQGAMLAAASPVVELTAGTTTTTTTTTIDTDESVGNHRTPLGFSATARFAPSC